MKEIATAIIAVMTDVNGVEKSMTVGSGNNSYKGVSDKDVKMILRSSMIKNGLSILPISVNPTIRIDRWEEVDAYSKSTPKDMKSKQSIFTEVNTRYLLLHTSGESIELAGYGQGVDTQDKGSGKATTYALKNTLLNMFLIPTGVDTDNTHSDDMDIPRSGTRTMPSNDFMDYIERIKQSDDMNELKIVFTEASDKFKSQKQIDWLVKEKDLSKKRLENN